MSIPNIVILISGRGSNMRAVAEACRAQAWPARVAAVISNRPDASGLQWAREQGLNSTVVDHCNFGSRDAFDAALAAAIDAHTPAVVVLAGFMRVLGADFVRRYSGRLINVHPSLLPAFAGLHTHRRALEAGVKWHGATVHLVTPDVDHGPIVDQAVVPVRDDDDACSLAARVLEQEHRMLAPAVLALLQGRLQVSGLRVRTLSATRASHASAELPRAAAEPDLAHQSSPLARRTEP